MIPTALLGFVRSPLGQIAAILGLLLALASFAGIALHENNQAIRDAEAAKANAATDRATIDGLQRALAEEHKNALADTARTARTTAIIQRFTHDQSAACPPPASLGLVLDELRRRHPDRPGAAGAP